MNPVEYKKSRAQLTSVLKRLIRPHLQPSGYRDGPVGASKPLNLWVPRKPNGRPTMKSFSLKGGFVVNEFEGFTAQGVIVDAFAGGLVTMEYGGMPIEGLYRLHQWALRRFGTAKAKLKQV